MDDRDSVRYVIDEDDCIACGLCHERAPDNIELDERKMVARITRQPSQPSEQAACQEAAEYCPTGGLHPAKPKSLST